MDVNRFKKNEGIIDSKKIIKEIENYEFISFDVFDTLLKRNVHKPSDVFYMVEAIACKENKCYKGFYDRRKTAETLARELSNEEEITLDEVYNAYEKHNYEDIDYLKKLEMRVEQDLLVTNLDIKEVYNYCINSGKKVFIISDMYLPEQFIKSILDQNGFVKYEKLYVSSEYRRTKKTGSLFKIFLKENGLKPYQVTHIGDAYSSDIEIPKKLGINTIHVCKNLLRDKKSYNNKKNSIKLNNLYSFINNTVDTNKSAYYRFGYDSFGPFLWGFTKWLYSNAQLNHIERLYFFSRDGLIMKKAFDILYPDNGVKTFYLEVSRRSLRVPVLSLDSSFENLLSTITVAKMVPIRAIFDGAGLDINHYEKILTQYGFQKDTFFDRKDIENDINLRKLYEEIRGDIDKISKIEFDSMVSYITQKQLKGKFGVVDIGWSGGMQRYLEQVMNIIGIENDVYGYYMGVTDSYTRNIKILPSMKMKGYLFDCFSNAKDYDKRSSFVGLFESLCLEQGGSVKNYAFDGETVKANRYEYEYFENGKPTKEYLRIKKVQEGALHFIKCISNDNMLNQWQYSADELFCNLRKTGANPDIEDVKMFGGFRFYDEGVTSRLAAPRSLLYYTIHPKKAKSDFLSSKWKTGFMKKLFRVKLPYEKIFFSLYKLK